MRRDADAAAIDRAWRTLLKRHHPDIAGAAALELAKLINVAHDWLGDVGRRARYDAATGGLRRTPASRATCGRVDPRPHAAAPASPAPSSPPDDLDAHVRSRRRGHPILPRPGGRHSRATTSTGCRYRIRWTRPRSCGTSYRPSWWARIDAISTRRVARLAPAGLRADRRAAAAAAAASVARSSSISLLWHYLADPEPLLDQMRRAWESSVGLPRYGPNTTEVAAADRSAREASSRRGARPRRRRGITWATRSRGRPTPGSSISPRSRCRPRLLAGMPGKRRHRSSPPRSGRRGTRRGRSGPRRGTRRRPSRPRHGAHRLAARPADGRPPSKARRTS